MGLRPLALFDCLVRDLSKHLPSVPFEAFYAGKLRDCVAWPGIGAKDFACLSLVDSLFKKLKDDKAPDADAKALAKFIDCNSLCRDYSAIDESAMTEIQAIALGEFRKRIYDFFYEPDITGNLSPNDTSFIADVSENGTVYAGVPKTIFDDFDAIVEGLDVGPGSSVGASGTSFYHKIAAGPLTCTNKSLYSLYLREIAHYPLWLETEKIRSGHYGEYGVIPGSLLSFVPKSIEISRTICTEPSLNMLFQKGIGKRLELGLRRRCGIDLSVQPDKNRELTRMGSWSGAYGTIDLSSASDTISLRLCELILPPTITGWLKLARSPSVILPNGEELQLHMVSSMGNAFTFPLQTIIFSSVVLGVYSALGITPDFPFDKNVGNFAVFGDDIVVRREAYDLVVNILGRLGFLVNTTKSFNDGPFRESCGCDFWSGQDVRGVYCESLETKQDLYSLINRLNVWCSNHGVYLTETVGLLRQWCGRNYNPVPPWESDVSGIKVPLWLLPESEQERDIDTRAILYSRYLPKDSALSLLSLESRPKVLERLCRNKTIHNPSGVLLAAIGGYLRDGSLRFRMRTVFYTKRLALAPCWDWIDPCSSILTSYGWQRWKNDVVFTNLGSGL